MLGRLQQPEVGEGCLQCWGVEEERGISSPRHLELRGLSVLCPQGEEGRQSRARLGFSPGLWFLLCFLLPRVEKERHPALEDLPRKEKREEGQDCIWKVNTQSVTWCLGSSFCFPLSPPPSKNFLSASLLIIRVSIPPQGRIHWTPMPVATAQSPSPWH